MLLYCFLLSSYRRAFTFGFSGVTYANSPLQPELQALQQGLSIAIDRQLEPVEIETHCAQLIKAIYHGNPTYNSLVLTCRWLMLNERMVVLKHNFRERNQVAHALATATLNKSAAVLVHRFVIPPRYVLALLDKDRVSTPLAKKSLGEINCRTLAYFDNQCVLGDTTMYCNSLST
ncbi:hypothetical protein RND71_017263 [Anisodus tanguticus]|uniref:RNase H type-1 domain-containing protein n=1 Tax=Anisodus tanguticus TaxID=243964 RepID=A0AAE1S2F2_9SOLA|nr:hypothetical protein RND71_017263 [Anisodus tanguticus]